ncbi:MAG TPA: PAS domain-containing protein [Vicinamibacterales bacterium]|nr:PAS domain-containing protein [Vicinamibacterales bacterium]
MELHNQILSALEVNVAILDMDGVIVDVSDSWTEFAKANGGSLDSIGVGVNYLEVCRRSAECPDARAALAGILSVISGRSPEFRCTYRCDAPDEPRLFIMTVKPLPSGTKGAIVAHHNNTEIESTQLLHGHLLDSVRAIVWRAELPGFRTTFASKQATDILGYPVEQWTSDPTWWIERIHPDDRDSVLRVTSAAVEQRRNHSFEYRMIAADGRVVWLRNIVNVIVEGTRPRELVGVSIDITERKNVERVRDELAGRLLAAQEDERRTIARELHDDIGQSVALLNMTLASIRQRLGVADVSAELGDMSALGIGIAKDLERIAQGLHPSLLEHQGLAGSVRHLCDEFGKRHSAAVECRIGDVPNDLDRSVAITLYRVSQEALRNIFKHAAAKNVTLELSASDREVRLSITDNGSGFDVASAHDARGLGLVSMNERLRLVAGTLEISSTVGEGTRIEATVPLGRHREDVNSAASPPPPPAHTRPLS